MTEITNEIIKANTSNKILRIENQPYTSIAKGLDFRGLKEIHINNCKLYKISSYTFANSNILNTINLSNNILLQDIEIKAFIYCSPTDIDLSNCNLETIDIHMFTELYKLISINLSFNRNLKKIKKKSFSHLPELKYINLSHCNLEIIETNAFKNLELSILDLSNNRNLKNIKDIFSGLYLKNIYLSNCDLHEITSELFYLNGLKEIDLSYNRNLKYLEDNFFLNEELGNINLSNCNLQIIKGYYRLGYQRLGYQNYGRRMCHINLDNNNLIYYYGLNENLSFNHNYFKYHYGINENVRFNRNYFNNEEHPFLTKLRNKLNENYNSSFYTHYNYFKNLDKTDIIKINIIIDYILNLYEIENNLFKKNIIIIFYIINILLTNVNIFEYDLELKTLIENFIDYFLNFLKYRLNERIHRSIEKIPKNIKKTIDNFYSNNKIYIPENFYSNNKIYILQNFCSNKNFVKCIFYIIIELTKNYNDINIRNKIHDIKVFIKTPVYIPKYNLSKKREIHHLLNENSLMNRLSREELEKQKFDKLINKFKIEAPLMDTKQKIYIYNKIKSLRNTNNLSKEIDKIKIDIIKSNKFYDKFKSKNKTKEERKRVQNEIKKFFYFINDISNKYINKKEILLLRNSV